MSHSPPIRRLSTAASSREELINAYEAEEERIINVLSRKLEQVSRNGWIREDNEAKRRLMCGFVQLYLCYPRRTAPSRQDWPRERLGS